MDVMSLTVHLLNFIAPACAVASWMALVTPLVSRISPSWRAWRRQFLLNSVIGGCVLLIGLLWLGNDGKVLTYAAMVLACAATQWLLTL
ncbi:MAG: hypothetical protein EXR37_02305 [Limnohabitans sp.]|nr:hypothetical protein [Limnohabitans sp.]